jgi:serine/threonine protein kinase
MVDDPLIGYQVGNYRIERLIGRGGMAQVYYGWDQGLHRPVAVKVIDARLRGNHSYAQRFVQEARAVATWRHDNILQVFYAGDENGLYYFAMEYVDGLDLGQLMAQYAHDEELLPHKDVLKIGRAIANALDYAHQKGVIHRDVKPSNVMLARDGRIVLADFGLAMDIQQGSIGEAFGTPHYIAPEQARNSSTAVAQSDLYSLTVILYEMLTGIVPFDDPSPTTLAIQHITLPPPPPRVVNPDLNEATEAVLLKSLAKTPEARYQTGAELLEALTTALTEGVAPTAAVAEEATSQQPAPLPIGFTPPPPRAVSSTTVAERVSLLERPELPPAPAPIPLPSKPSPPLSPVLPLSPVPPPSPMPPPSPVASPPPMQRPITASPPAPKSRNPWLIPAGIVLLLLVAFGGGRLLSGGGDNAEATAVVTNETVVTNTPAAIELVVLSTETPEVEPQPQPTDEMAATAEVVAADPAINTPEFIPATEIPAADTPTPEPATQEPATPEPTDVAQVEDTPTTETIAEATIAYPNGRRIELLYDDNSFYFYNPNSERVDLRPLSFEAIDANGNLLRYQFDASMWTQFYTYVENGRCDRIEITRSDGYLRPPQCRSYNASVTPDRDTDLVFWIAKAGIARFRVSWNGNEIARCEIGGERCEVYLP